MLTYAQAVKKLSQQPLPYNFQLTLKWTTIIIIYCSPTECVNFGFKPFLSMLATVSITSWNMSVKELYPLISKWILSWCFTQLLFGNVYVVLILFQIAAEFRVASTLTTPGSKTKFEGSRWKRFCTLFSFCFSYCRLATVLYRSWVAINAQNNDNKTKYREQNQLLSRKQWLEQCNPWHKKRTSLLDQSGLPKDLRPWVQVRPERSDLPEKKALPVLKS